MSKILKFIVLWLFFCTIYVVTVSFTVTEVIPVRVCYLIKFQKVFSC